MTDSRTIRDSQLGREIVAAGMIDDSQVDSVLERVRQRMGTTTREAPDQRFVILRQLGAGGCGRVYLAYDTELDRRVALKQLLGRDEVDQAQLVREAQMLAQVRHPNIVSVHDITEVVHAGGQARPCIVMEFVEGMTLREWLKAEPRRQKDVVRVLCEAGRGLAAAHAAGIIHRDFKPDNVIIDADDRARVLDFGLSQGTQADKAEERGQTDSELEFQEVRITGTPSYMAPERFIDTQIDARSDIFSFAVTVWEALAGERPFVGKTIFEIRRKILIGLGKDSTRGFPRRIARILRRGLETDPEFRYPSMPAMLRELERDPWQQVRRAARVVGGILVCAAIAILIVYATRPARIEVRTSGPRGPLRASQVQVDDLALTLRDDAAVGEVAPGLHRLRVEAAGMQPVEQIVELERGRTREHSVMLKPQQGTLTIEAAPTGASVWLDGVEFGSRLRDHPLDIGTHSMRIQLLGHYDHQQTLHVEADQAIDTFVSLTPALVWSRRQTGVRHPPTWVGDWTGDGRLEVAHQVFSTVTVSDPWTDRDLWSVHLDEHLHIQTLWVDHNGDGRSELLAFEPGDTSYSVTMWASDGSGGPPRKLWRQAVDHANNAKVEPMLVTLGDHPDTVVVADFPPGQTVALNLDDGSTRWQVAGSRIHRQATLARADGTTWVVQHEGRSLRALDAASGALTWASALSVHTLAALDIDGDSNDELLAQTRDGSMALLLSGHDGTVLWSQPAVSWNLLAFEAGQTPLVALRRTADNQTDVVDVVDASGSILWSHEVPAYSETFGTQPSMVMVVHAGGVEFLARDTGELIDEIATAGTPGSRPLRVDWDGDGEFEWVLGCHDRRLVALRPVAGVVGAVTLDSPVDRLVAGDGDRDGFAELLVDSRGPAVVTGQQRLWWRRAADGLRATPVVRDFDGDGELEVAMFGDFDHLNTLNLFSATNGQLEHRASSIMRDALRPPVPVKGPAGELDLLATSSRSLARFSGRDARLLAQVTIPSSYTSPLVADVDGDGRDEVVTVPWSGDKPLTVHRLADLSVKWTVPVRNDGTWAQPYLYQHENQPVFVLALHNGDVTAISSTGERWRTALDTRHFYTPVAFDFEQDGVPELLTEAAGDRGAVDLVALRRDSGEVVRRFPGLGSPLGRVVVVEHASGDRFLVVATTDRGVVAVEPGGDIRWRFSPVTAGTSPRGTAPLQATDLDGDGEVEILAPLRDGVLYVLSSTTGELRFRVATGDPNIEAAPVVADLDADGAPEILLAGHDRDLVVIRPPRGH